MELSDSLIRTRGKKFKLVQHHCHYDLRKYNFTNRVIPIWNSLSNFVVFAETINTLKNRLDKFWSNQDVLFDYKADLHGIGNRSIFIYFIYLLLRHTAARHSYTTRHSYTKILKKIKQHRNNGVSSQVHRHGKRIPNKFSN